jgi:hypothetical protein
VQWLNPSPQPNNIAQDLHLINTGVAAVDLTSVKIHYYYTADGDTFPVFVCDYAGYVTGMAGLSSSNVMGAFVSLGANATPYADTFLEISFTSQSLSPGSSAAVNFRIHNGNNYSVNYNQSNDWSNLSPMSAMSYVDAPYITAYLNGTLAWGIEPGNLPGDAGQPLEAGQPQDGASDVSGN